MHGGPFREAGWYIGCLPQAILSVEDENHIHHARDPSLPVSVEFRWEFARSLEIEDLLPYGGEEYFFVQWVVYCVPLDDSLDLVIVAEIENKAPYCTRARALPGLR